MNPLNLATQPEPPPAELAPSCAEAGVLGVLPGIVGSIQAIETIKLLLDLGDPLEVEKVTLDGREVEAEHNGKDLVVKAPVRRNRKYALVVQYSGTPEPAKAPTTRSDFSTSGWTVDDDAMAVLPFAVDPSFPWPPGDVDRGADEEALAAFVRTVRERHVVRPFGDLTRFREDLLVALHRVGLGRRQFRRRQFRRPAVQSPGRRSARSAGTGESCSPSTRSAPATSNTRRALASTAAANS